MSRLKKILLTLPEAMLDRLDSAAKSAKTNRSELIRCIFAEYFCKIDKEEINEQLKKGYQLMAEINLEEAEFALQADNNQLEIYERKLSECE